MVDKQRQGRLNKAAGARFETKVREDLKAKGWFVSKFQSNVEFETDDYSKGALIPSKHKYNPFIRSYSLGSGFPDFIAYRKIMKGVRGHYMIIGVEAKSNGFLTKLEKMKCVWLLDNNAFSKILIAKKKKEGRKIIVEYDDFKDKYYDKYKNSL